MSKTISDLLFRLIKALTPAEKRYFKLYASRHTIGNKNEYLKLFEAVDKMQEYNEQLLKKSFKQFKAKNTFTIAKSRLYETVLRCLDAFHSESSVDVQMRSQLHYAEILFKKSLYDECHKILYKTKKTAERFEKHSILIDIYNWEKRLIEKDGYTTIKEDELNKILEEDVLAIDRISNYSEFWHIKSRLFFMLNRFGKVRDVKELENFKTIIDNVLLKSENAALTYETRYLYLHIYSAYYFGISDYANCYQYIKRLLKLMEDNSDKLKEEPNKYFAALSNMIYLCSQLNKLKEVHSWLAKLRNIKSLPGVRSTEDLEIKLFSTSYSAELSLYIKTGNFQKAYNLIPEIENGLRKYKINKVREGYFCFNIAIVLFSLGRYNDSLKWLNRLLNESELDAHQDIYTLARLFDLVVHIEIGNNDLIPYTIRSVLRYLNKRKRMYKFEPVFLDFIKVIAKAKTKEDQANSFLMLRNELQKLYNDPYEKPVFEIFDFLSWAESKVRQLTYAELIRQKQAMYKAAGE